MRRHLLLCVLPFSAPEREPETACHQIPERGPTTEKAKTRGSQRRPYSGPAGLPKFGYGRCAGKPSGRGRWGRRRH